MKAATWAQMSPHVAHCCTLPSMTKTLDDGTDIFDDESPLPGTSISFTQGMTAETVGTLV
jgi:hypothetical protein